MSNFMGRFNALIVVFLKRPQGSLCRLQKIRRGIAKQAFLVTAVTQKTIIEGNVFRDDLAFGVLDVNDAFTRAVTARAQRSSISIS
jgi:hypothetical protein